MLGLLSRRKNEKNQVVDENLDVAKLFFDSFSKRVDNVEVGLKMMSDEIEKLKGSADRSRLSDLVLLERLQKAEVLVKESLTWIRQTVEVSRQVPEALPAKEERPTIGVQ